MNNLDRNLNPDGRGKYALVKMCKVAEILALGELVKTRVDLVHALTTLARLNVIDYGTGPGTPGDFFVIRLGDKFAGPALAAYAVAASDGGTNPYADDVATLAVAAYKLNKQGQSKLPD